MPDSFVLDITVGFIIKQLGVGEVSVVILTLSPPESFWHRKNNNRVSLITLPLRVHEVHVLNFVHHLLAVC